LFDSDRNEKNSTRPSSNRKRGRPKAYGQQPDWMLFRRFVILWVYNQARKAGEKHSIALNEAAAAVRSCFPKMPVSASEVRRTLAEWQPKSSPIAIIVNEIPNTELRQAAALQQALDIPEGALVEYGFQFGLGAHPQYPRTNARSRITSSQATGT
jgi:hypothetical protein